MSTEHSSPAGPSPDRPTPDWHDRFAASGCYLNTASMGVPPLDAVAAVRDQVDRWQRGEVDIVDYWATRDRARSAYAALVGVGVDEVFLGSQTSALTGVIAASVPDGGEVLVADDEYASLSHPFAAHRPRITVRTAPAARLADAVGPATTLVAASMVRSGDGDVADLPRLLEATRAVGAELLLDTTQSAGWLPTPLDGVGYTVCSAYKWLMAPRGAAYGTIRRDLVERTRPVLGNAEAADGSLYGADPQWAPDARRFDVSPAWPSWAGVVPALELIAAIGVDRVGAHNTALARACSDALGLPSNGSAIIAVPVGDEVMPALSAAGITASVRAGRLRLAFALHNTADDVDRVCDVVGPRLT